LTLCLKSPIAIAPKPKEKPQLKFRSGEIYPDFFILSETLVATIFSLEDNPLLKDILRLLAIAVFSILKVFLAIDAIIFLV
jgi:hypothetical protein